MNKNSIPALILIASAAIFASRGAGEAPAPSGPTLFPAIAAVFEGKPSDADSIAGLAAGMADMIEADAALPKPKLLYVASVSTLWASGAKILAEGGMLSYKYPGFAGAVDAPFREVFPNETAAEPLIGLRQGQAVELFRSLSAEVDKAR